MEYLSAFCKSYHCVFTSASSIPPFAQLSLLSEIVHPQWRNVILRLCPESCWSSKAQGDKKVGPPKFFLFYPNSLPKVTILLTYRLLKTTAKTSGMLAHAVTVRSLQTKGQYLNTVPTSLFENKLACTFCE